MALINRIENDGFIEVQYASSNIQSSMYNNNSGDLIITFSGGRQYFYSNVDKNDYMKFELAESQGKVFNSLIKNKYDATVITGSPIENKIIKEEETISAPELKDGDDTHCPKFRTELTELLNRYSEENGSNTPDYILANYLIDCLRTYNSVVLARDAWYGKNK